VTIVLPVSIALSHPSVDGHLHAATADCSDPVAGTVAAIRRAGVLSDDDRTDDALAELDAACLPDDDVVQLARARTLVHGDRPQQALDVLDAVAGADAAMWRAHALVALHRGDEAGRILAENLVHLPDAPPEAYLLSAELCPPCTAVELLELGLQRRGDVGSLRRASATAALACPATASSALDRLRTDVVRDQLLAGELLTAQHPHEARARYTSALVLVEAQRDTPARAEMKDLLTQRIADLDTP